MSGTDIGIVIVVSIILLVIIFFHFIYPHISGKKKKCSSCPMGYDKKVKRAFKAYHKNKKEKENEKSHTDNK